MFDKVNGRTISKNDEIAECLNSYYVTITETLNIDQAPTSDLVEPSPHPFFEAIQKFRSHPNVIKIRHIVEESAVFQFYRFEPADIWDEINRLGASKNTSGNLPTHILMLTSDLSFSAATKLANKMVEQCTFPEKLKTIVNPLCF